MAKDMWDVVKSGLSFVAPLLSSAVIPGSGGVVGPMVANLLGVDNEPNAIAKALENPNPDLVRQLKQIESDNAIELRKIAAQVEVARLVLEGKEIAAGAESIESVNKSIRIEATAEDPWTRRWRPFWGYMSAVAFFMICGAIGAAIIWGTNDILKELGSIVMSIAALFAIPGAILGVSAWHRGVKQRVEAGDKTGSGLIAAAFAKKIGGKQGV